MIEIIENAIQLGMLGACLVLSLVHLYRRRDDLWIFLSSFYGCTFFALVYWLGYLVVFGVTPYLFYVSDLGWTASYLFMLVLEARLDEMRAPEPPVVLAWIPVVLTVPFFLLFITHGDLILNVVQCSQMAAIAFFAVRGVCSPYGEGLAGNRWFHVSVLVWVAVQLLEWAASCFWGAETFTPLIASDLALSATYAIMLVCAWREGR